MRVASRLKHRGKGVPPVSPGQDAPATFNTYNPHEPVQRRQGAYLPHWTQEGATYAVNFRLGDSLPEPVWQSFLQERNDILKRALQQGRELSEAERERLDELYSERVESYLDAGHGACWLRQEPVAQLVQNALRHFDGERYRLAAWCVMPNHVHVVVQPLADHTLPDILHSWKSYTSKEANKLLGRTGKFWQDEYYDHLIRDQSDFERQVRYALENPVKAGLNDWTWLGRAPGLLPRLYAPGAAPDKMLGQDGQATRGTGVPPVSPGQDAAATSAGLLFEELGRDAQATRTWLLLTKAEVETRLSYPVTELPRNEKWGDLDVAKVKHWVCIPAMIQYTIWSEVYRCEGFITIEEPTGKVSTRGKNTGKPIMSKKRVARGCRNSIVLWSVAVDPITREVKESFRCPHCNQEWKKLQLTREGDVPVLTVFEFLGITSAKASTQLRSNHNFTAAERSHFSDLEKRQLSRFFPSAPIDAGREMMRHGLLARGLTHQNHFYTPRLLHALSAIWQQIETARSSRLQQALRFAFTAGLHRCSRLNRLRPSGAGDPLTGTLYIGSLWRENHVLNDFMERQEALVTLASKINTGRVNVREGSATHLVELPDESVDYVFTDPPFGSNLFYADCSMLWESWLGRSTDESLEMVVSDRRVGGAFKTLDDYAKMMTAAIREMYRVLKPGRWATIEFNNSDGKVFKAIKRAVQEAGFEIANMLLLDKAQKSFKQTKGVTSGEEDVVDKDVLFNLHKPAVVRAEVRAEDHDLQQQLADAVRQHLQTLPERIKADPAKYNEEHRTTATINSMLMNTLIPRGVSVARLNLPFIERVCSRYFRKVGQRWYLRGEAVGGNGSGLVQEDIAIKDELTAIAWLRQKLCGTGIVPVAQGQDAPATWLGRPAQGMLIGELKPHWMKATGLLPANISQELVLEHLLAENFWRDADSNRWREPTVEERERMNDDRSLRVLHDAEWFVNNTLDLPTTDDERCQWIDVLFQASRAIEDNEAEALPALRGFDKAEAYSLIPRLFQSILRDHVSKDAYTRTEKQARAASQRVAKEAEQEPKAKGKRDAGEGQSVLEFD